MDKDEVLEKLAKGEISKEEAKQLLEQAERHAPGTLYLKVSPKKALSLYGLQRMPVTLYVEQWLRLLDFGDQIRKFIEEHDKEFKRKGQ
jgi:hypothetical protein